MYFPTNIANNYIDTLYNAFLPKIRNIISVPFNNDNNDINDEYNGNPLNIFDRHKYNISIIACAIKGYLLLS